MAITYTGGITITGGITQTVLGVGGSTSYNGTTQYLTLPNSSVPADISTGDFTVECWFNSTDVARASAQTLIWLGGNTNAYATFRLGIDTSGIIFYVSTDGATWAFNSGIIGTVSSNTWYHVAVTRSGSTFKVYLNGVQIGTNYTQSGTLYAGTLNYIGALNYSAVVSNPYRQMQGYISNVRITKGVVVYTAAFSIPTQPLTSLQSANVNGNPSAAITGTSTGVLLNMPNNSSFLADSSTNNVTVTNVASVASSTLTPFNPGSVLFNGTSQYLSAPANAAYAFGTGDFTVEAWINPSSTSGNRPICQSDALGTSQNDKWWFAVAGGGLFFGTHNAGGFNVVTSTSFTLGTWYHVAVTRASGVMKMFINGVSTAFTTSGTPSGYSLSQNGMTVGAMSTPSYWSGYISNLRVVKGLAVYTSTFTPATAPLTSTQSANQNGNPSAAITGTSTSLLLNTQNGPAFLVDGSTNNATITNTGSATSQSSIPFSL